jgi:hypothetical protein
LSKIKADILGLPLDEEMALDVTIRKLEDIPNAIEQFVKDKVVEFLKEKFLAPILENAEKAKEAGLSYPFDRWS